MKLVVGIDSLFDFAKWQEHEVVSYKGREANIIVTRYMPKQSAEILVSGGSAYRVIKGIMSCRQKILGFENADTQWGPKCFIYTDTTIMRTVPKPRKAFQGWRYLKEADVPADVAPYAAGDDLPPPEMECELSELGLL